MSDLLKTPASIAPDDIHPIDIVHAYQSVVNACGMQVAQELLDELEIDAPAVLDPIEYDHCLSVTRMLIRYSDRL